MYDAILHALRSGARDEALDRARALVDENPDDPQAHRWLAVALAEAGQAGEALARIEHALALAPEEAELHTVHGSLLIGSARREQAEAALAKATGLDPNQAMAYLLRAQLALARGDADEAERQAALLARLAPAHPQLVVIEGIAALRRGHPDRALKVLSAAAEAGNQEPQLFYGLGHACLQLGHLAFAEQAFSRLLERSSTAPGLRALLADLQLRQRRPDEALRTLQPLLEQPDPGFALQRLAGVLELATGQPGRALPWLRAAFGRKPDDPRLLIALVETWQRLGEAQQAITDLDAALENNPSSPALWQARLAFAPPGREREVLDRWLAARPDEPVALELLAMLHDRSGEHEEAVAATRRLAARAPGRYFAAELRLAGLEMREDPRAAIARLQEMLPLHPAPEQQRMLRARLTEARDRAGDTDLLAVEWRQAGAAAAALPATTAAPAQWPAPGDEDAAAPAVALLWGPPGSGAGILAGMAAAVGLPLLHDRLGRQSPGDPLQSSDTPARLLAGELDGEAVVAQWRAALPRRGLAAGPVIDWLPHWDNALLLALRPHLPGARLLVVLRDPRDMLLNWLAFGAPLAPPAPVEGARWLSGVLGQVVQLHEQDLQPHRLLRLDEALGRPDLLVDTLNIALDIDMEPPPHPPPPGPWLPSGRWRAYRGPLGEAFAELHAVAVRLGYPEA